MVQIQYKPDEFRHRAYTLPSAHVII